MLLSAPGAMAGTGPENPCRKVVLTADPDFPPYAWYDGRTLKGAGVEMAARALDKIGLPYEIRYVGPFGRVLHEAEHGGVDIIAELKDTPERRAYLVFSASILYYSPTAVFVPLDRPLVYRGWDDLKNAHGLKVVGTRFGGGFDEFLAGNLQMEEIPDIDEAFMMLKSGRADYFVSAYYPAASALSGMGMANEFKALTPFVTEAEIHAGWSKASPCLAYLPAFDRALADDLRSGAAARLMDAAQKAWEADPRLGR